MHTNISKVQNPTEKKYPHLDCKSISQQEKGELKGCGVQLYRSSI